MTEFIGRIGEKNMTKRFQGLHILVFIVILLLVTVSAAGALSFRTDRSFMAVNQYGHQIKMFGSGIYAHDSYFKAPILIGSDVTMLLLAVPLLAAALIGDMRKRTAKARLFLISTLAIVVYNAASICFGVTYNSFLLIYIALFSASFFALIMAMRQIDTTALRAAQQWRLPTGGIAAFLIISGVALFVAWLPDIIGALAAGTTLPLIEVYTTEITYVIDMGIVSPLMFICLYLLRKRDGLGDVLLGIILMTCTIIGVMLPVQSLFQVMAGIELPVPVLVTKVAIFVLLAVFAAVFNARLYRNLKA